MDYKPLRLLCEGVQQHQGHATWSVGIACAFHIFYFLLFKIWTLPGHLPDECPCSVSVNGVSDTTNPW